MVDDTRTSKRIENLDNGGFVEVMFAKSQHEAADLCNLLEEQHIPVRLEESTGPVSHSGIALLVPSARLVEASELLAGFDQEEEEEEFDDDAGDDEEEEYEDEDEDDDFDDDFDDEEEDEEYEDLEDDDDI